jgi:hypothetical protein
MNSIKTKMIRLALAGFLAVTLLAGVLVATERLVLAQGASDPTLQMTPDVLTIAGVGMTNTQEIEVIGVSDLYGVEFTIEYDPNVVQPIDREPGTTPGVQIAVGPLFTGAGEDYYVGRNVAYTDTGDIDFQATLRSPAPPFSGTETAALVTWACIAEGESAVTFTMSKLGSYPDGGVISHAVSGGTVACSEEPPPSDAPTISGRVLLQGRNVHEGTYIFVVTEQTDITASNITLESPIPGVPYTTTNATGDFSLLLYEPPAPYELPYKCLQAVQKGYLVGQYCPSGGFTTDEDLGVITLPGGDATEDDKINIFDLAFIAARYNSDDETADVNGDGTVDIYDLVITAGNLNLNGPVEDWQ